MPFNYSPGFTLETLQHIGRCVLSKGNGGNRHVTTELSEVQGWSVLWQRVRKFLCREGKEGERRKGMTWQDGTEDELDCADGEQPSQDWTTPGLFPRLPLSACGETARHSRLTRNTSLLDGKPHLPSTPTSLNLLGPGFNDTAKPPDRPKYRSRRDVFQAVSADTEFSEEILHRLREWGEKAEDGSVYQVGDCC